jgi:hypothetical protein
MTDYGNKAVINCTTGEVTSVPYTAEEIAARDAERAAAALASIVYSITPASAVIIANGVDSASFTVRSDPADATVNLLVGGIVETVEMTDGVGYFDINSEVAGVITITGETGPLAEIHSHVYAAQAVPPPGAPII